MNRIRSLALVALTVAVTIPWTASAKVAGAYSCSGNTVCYGTIQWRGAIDGAITSIVSLPVLIAGDGHANIELWLTAPVPSGQNCPAFGTQYNGCWIEVGAKAGPQQCKTNIPCYFWNDLRPCSGCYNNYYTHWMADIPSGDIGNDVDLSIQRTDSSDFALLLSSANLFLPDSSTGNDMSPNYIDIGAELIGTTGASIGHTSFRNNQWEPVGANYFNPQTVNGVPTVNSPVQAYWATTPSTPNSNGGIWNVYCPC